MSSPGGSYHSGSVPGDVFLDRTLGIATVVLSAVGLGTAIYRVMHPPMHYDFEPAVREAPGGEPARIAMIVLAIVAGLAIARSGLRSFQVATALFGVRLAVDFACVPYVSMRDRFLPMQIFFDLCMVAYCWFRIRTLRSKGA